jgi:hypothetical protein
MTLRDYFAGQVIAGIMASSVDTMRAMMRAAKRDGTTLDDGLAGGAYELADAMLKAREQ